MSEQNKDAVVGAPFESLGETVMHESWIKFVEARFRAPDGREFTREIVHHPGAVSIVPLMEDNDTVIMVRQYRAALGQYLLEIPAGKRDVEGEAPLATAHRELEEEIGMHAGRMDPLYEFFNSPGLSDERQCLFLARDLTDATLSRQGIEEEHMTIERVSLKDLPQLMASFTIRDAKTVLGLLLTRDLLAAEAHASS